MVKLYSVALNYFFSSRPSFCPNRQKSQHRKKSCKISKYQKILKISALICLVIFGVSLYKYYINYADDIEDFGIRRQLRNKLCKGNQQDDDSGCPDKAHPPGIIIFHLLGALYFFVAIAIACDDFFVPALEAIGKRWEISDDVAGATLMAAGGSAPELATSFIGTFQGSDVGFGTIVGSAVFNVLFIIAICVLCTPKHFAPLKLTAWPLARDCSYYVVTLIMVAMVFGIITPGIIEAWEAVFLFVLYIGYCVLMYYNEDLYQHFVMNGKISDVAMNDPGAPSNNGGRDSVHRRGSVAMVVPSRFRAGLLQILTSSDSIFDYAGVYCVHQIAGDVRTVFDQLDTDKSGVLEAREIRNLLTQLYDAVPNMVISDDHIQEVMTALDIDKNGVVDFAEFTRWYVKSEERIKNEDRRIFNEFDIQQNGTITLRQLEQCLIAMQVENVSDMVQSGYKVFGSDEKGGDNHEVEGRITWEEFYDWLVNANYMTKKKNEAEIAAEDAEGVWGHLLDFPKSSLKENAMYLFLAPITWPLALTCGLKDVRIPGNEGWCFYEFFTSVAWIGGYAYVLVGWVETFGATLGIPSVVMGLTILAAGTSIPDLLSSVVVARAGKGDMAVSSSIGSNIFDVCVGLPLPWMLFNAVFDCPVVVAADNLFISLIVLILMVASVIICIILSGWKMSYALGAAMMILYLIFLTQDVVRVYVMSNSVGC